MDGCGQTCSAPARARCQSLAWIWGEKRLRAAGAWVKRGDRDERMRNLDGPGHRDLIMSGIEMGLSGSEKVIWDGSERVG